MPSDDGPDIDALAAELLGQVESVKAATALGDEGEAPAELTPRQLPQYETLLSRFGGNTEELMVSLEDLGNHPVWSSLSLVQLMECVSMMGVVSVTAGTTVLTQGERADRMLFVIDGSLTQETDSQAHQQHAVTIHGGATLGEDSLISDGGKNQYTVSVKSGTARLLIMLKSNFVQLPSGITNRLSLVIIKRELRRGQRQRRSSVIGRAGSALDGFSQRGNTPDGGASGRADTADTAAFAAAHCPPRASSAKRRASGSDGASGAFGAAAAATRRRSLVDGPIPGPSTGPITESITGPITGSGASAPNLNLDLAAAAAAAVATADGCPGGVPPVGGGSPAAGAEPRCGGNLTTLVGFATRKQSAGGMFPRSEQQPGAGQEAGQGASESSATQAAQGAQATQAAAQQPAQWTPPPLRRNKTIHIDRDLERWMQPTLMAELRR